MRAVELVHSCRVLESGARWSEWRICSWAPIDHPLGVAELVSRFSQDQAWLSIEQQHRLQIGMIENGAVKEIPANEIEDLL